MAFGLINSKNSVTVITFSSHQNNKSTSQIILIRIISKSMKSKYPDIHP